MKTILSHANLIDCVEPKLRPDAAVLIEDGRIRAILQSGEADSAGGDAQVIDLKGGYLMPGLWDVHIHPDYLSLDEMPLADQVTLFGHRLAAALTESGIVGLRCAGRITLWTWHGSGPSTPGSMSALGCSPAVISSPPPADTS
jgi:imidazolonepropionase-like amidohydrolase